MELLLRIRWRHAPAADLRMEVDAHHTMRDLLQAAATYCEVPWSPDQTVSLERLDESLDLDASVLDSGVVSGDIVELDRLGAAAPERSPLEGVSLDVTAGPDAGRSFVLDPGDHTVGRPTGSQQGFRGTVAVAIDDPTVADRQLTVHVGADLSTSVTPQPDTVNPVTINGHLVTETTTVTPIDVVQFGATAVAMRVFRRSSDAERDQLGQIPFRRTPHQPVVVNERVFKPLGRLPTKPEPRRFSPIPVIAPAVMGLGMYAITQAPTTLIMLAGSPVMFVANYFDGRKAGATQYQTRVADLERRVANRRREVDEALLAERAERIEQAPDLADLSRRARLRTLDLWPRQRADDEFLRTRLGIGSVASRVRVEPETGDEELSAAIAARFAGSDRLAASPVSVNLAQLGVFGLHGDDTHVQAMCASIVVQAATLHSPEDLVIVVLEGHDRGVGRWVKWLPHSRSSTSPLAGDHVVTTPGAAADMLRQLVAVATERDSDERNVDRRWPWVLVVLDESAEADPALVSQLLERCPDGGISVVAAVGSDARVPRQARATLRCVAPHRGELSSVWYTEPRAAGDEFEPETASPRLIERVAMALAPLRDATSSSATTAIPRLVPLLSMFGSERPTVESLTATWRAPKPYGLRAPIGVGAAGPLELDLVEHGPHALIGGTSGAGKSELLQSIVASLIHEYPPSRLSFLFVDYKGGAATDVFKVAPHTVGYVTNLDASLSLRALTSLRAELNHRMRLMEGRAKDLPEMLERYPNEAPPSMVIVVDEFATLMKEVPEFVAGVVDIAQRGRSLGVHLILATQRPSGSVNENILANTNLRISLRMLDAAESRMVIGTSDASAIPVPLKGRGFARLGPSELVEFQSAFTGARLTREVDVVPIGVQAFGAPPTLRGTSTATRRTATSTPTPTPTLDAAPVPAELLVPGMPLPPPRSTLAPPPSPLPPADTPAPVGETSAAPTHLEVLLEAAERAGRAWPSPRRPWREMLAEELDWFAIDGAADPPPTLPDGSTRYPGRHLTLGVLDDPAAQAQYPAVVDLEEGGGLLIGGAGGSGKTTALRTAAVAATVGARPDEVSLFVIDCASRSLRSLSALAHTAAVATGDDLESLTRIITLLSVEIERRRPLLAALDVQAENLSAYLDQGRRLPRVVVLIDGLPNLAGILGGVKPGEVGPLDWFAELQRIIVDGRQLGIHAIIATDRRQAAPPVLMSAIANRLVLRQTDETGYADYGVPMGISRGLDLPTGRAIWGTQLLQVGVIATDATAAGQSAAIGELAAAQAAAGESRSPLESSPPPDQVSVPLQATRPQRATIGRRDVFGDVVDVAVEHSGLLVTGPPRSGRTTALRQVAHSLVAGGATVWSVGLGDIGGAGRHVAGRSSAVVEFLQEFAAECESFPVDQPRYLVVDDADRYEDSAIATAYDKIVRTEAALLIGSLDRRNLTGYTQSSLINGLRRESTVLMLQPEGVSELLQFTGVRAQLRPGFVFGPGRGVLVADRRPIVVQVASEFAADSGVRAEAAS